MIQQILNMQSVQPTDSTNQSSNASKPQGADSFSSMLQAASQKTQPNDSGKTDAAQDGTKSKGDPSKDEKGPAKDAASFVQPNASSAAYASAQNGQTAAANAPVSALNGNLQGAAEVSAQIPSLQQMLPLQQTAPVQQIAQAQQTVQAQQVQTVPAVQNSLAEAVQEQQNPAPVTAKSEDAVSSKDQISANPQQVSALAVSSGKTLNTTEEQPVQNFRKPGSTDTESVKAEMKSTGNPEVSDGHIKKAEQISNLTGSGTRQLSSLYSDGKVVVKVSDASKAVKTPVTSQVADAVTGGLKNGKQELSVDLYPQSLGKVSVKLTTQNGVLTVEIAASNPKTQSLLASSSDEIKSILQSSTGQSIQITKPEHNPQWYGQDGNSGGQNAQQQQQQRQQQQAENQKNLSEWYSIGDSGNFSTDDFLSILKQTAASA